jgi:hypothetical protein
VPLVHWAVAFGTEHTTLQPPQFTVVVAMSVSQPFACLLPSQSPQPAEHAPTHAPPPQSGVTWFDEHSTLQPPQCAALVRVDTSQPSLALLPLQSAKPVAHTPLQLPDAHDGAGMWLLEQAAPHWPQLATSLVIWVSQPSVALALQSPNPAAHAMLHMPATHEGVPLVVEQALVHEPQWAESAFRFTSQPSTGLLLQSANPAAHMAMAHAPAVHAAVA